MSTIAGGVTVTGFISPTDDSDVYATHDSKYGIGGFREVSSIKERNDITVERRRIGMLVAVTNDIIYQLLGGVTNDCWQELTLNSVRNTQLQIAGSCIGKPVAGDIIMRFVTATRFQFYLNLPLSQARCSSLPTNDTVFNLCRNGSVFGTFMFTKPTALESGRFATFNSTNIVLFPQDELTVVAPTSFNDPTIADIDWTLVGYTI